MKKQMKTKKTKTEKKAPDEVNPDFIKLKRDLESLISEFKEKLKKVCPSLGSMESDVASLGILFTKKHIGGTHCYGGFIGSRDDLIKSFISGMNDCFKEVDQRIIYHIIKKHE